MSDLDPHARPRPRFSSSGFDVRALDQAAIEALAAHLDEETRTVILRKGTERPFCGNLLDNKQEGVYICRLCGLPLFASNAKFDSGTGWPSFFQPFDPDHVAGIEDRSLGMQRIEIVCMRCEAHLGHVFPDGPPPTGQRFCLNSVSLEFIGDDEDMPERSRPAQVETACFAAGCFWSVEDHFQSIPGVIDATSGYQGGHIDQPSYRDVCSGQSGHAEAVRVIYDPARVDYATLLDHFFRIHDPTTRDRQGPDVGSCYRSAIFATTDQQLETALAFVDELSRSGRFNERPIVTQVEPAPPFYEAEPFHQDFNARHGRTCRIG